MTAVKMTSDPQIVHTSIVYHPQAQTLLTPDTTLPTEFPSISFWHFLWDDGYPTTFDSQHGTLGSDLEAVWVATNPAALAHGCAHGLVH